MRRTSPTLAVVERIVYASGFDLDLSPRVEFTTDAGSCGEPYVVPDGLWRLNHTEALATVLLPKHLNGSVALFDRKPCRGGTWGPPVLVRWRV